MISVSISLVSLCLSVCGDQKTTLAVILQVLSMLVFETGSLAVLQLAKQARLSGERATKICLHIS